MFLSAASPARATSDAHSLYVNLELALNQTTVGTVIRSISEQTGYEFSYDETLLNKKISKVSVNLKNEHIAVSYTHLYRKDVGIVILLGEEVLLLVPVYQVQYLHLV